MAKNNRTVESREIEKRIGEEMLGVSYGNMRAGYLYCKKELLGLRKKIGNCCDSMAEK